MKSSFLHLFFWLNISALFIEKKVAVGSTTANLTCWLPFTFDKVFIIIFMLKNKRIR